MTTAQSYIFFSAIAYLGIVFICFYKASRRPPRANERDVLRRCRASLWMIRRDLESLPATRVVHEINAECDRTEDTINRVEAKVCR